MPQRIHSALSNVLLILKMLWKETEVGQHQNCMGDDNRREEECPVSDLELCTSEMRTIDIRSAQILLLLISHPLHIPLLMTFESLTLHVFLHVFIINVSS